MVTVTSANVSPWPPGAPEDGRSAVAAFLPDATLPGCAGHAAPPCAWPRERACARRRPS
jgi:hypothetical protein